MTLDEALQCFLNESSGDLGTDLVAAGREFARRRKEDPEAGVVVLAALRDEFGLTFAEIEQATTHRPSGANIPRATAARLVGQPST